eukprot:jgi/Botrbrau1/10272/Bobra.0140s0025.1
MPLLRLQGPLPLSLMLFFVLDLRPLFQLLTEEEGACHTRLGHRKPHFTPPPTVACLLIHTYNGGQC